MIPRATDRPTAHHVRRALQVAGFGLLLWVITAVVLRYTGSLVVLATLVLMGSFLPPAVVCLALWESSAEPGTRAPGLQQLLATFLGAGWLGIVLVAALETAVVNRVPGAWWPVVVAVVEEGVMLALIAVLAARLSLVTIRSGMLLGAAAGFGFAAFETAGYTAIILYNGRPAAANFWAVLATETTRGLLVVFGHGLWDAILAGALMVARASGRPALRTALPLWWLAIVALHALWDAARPISLRVTTTGSRAQEGIQGLILACVAVLGMWGFMRFWNRRTHPNG